MTWILTTSNFNILRSRSNANKKVIDKQYTFVLFSRVFATRKSRPALPAPLPFPLASNSSLFFSQACSLFSVTATSQPFVYQSLRHSFHRDGGSHPSSQKLCAIFAPCYSPLPVPKSRRPLPLRAPKPRRINTCKSLSKQRTLTSFRMIDLQKYRGMGGVMVNQLPPSTFNFRLSTSSPVTGLSRVRRGGGAEGPLPTSSRARIGELRVEWRLFLKSKGDSGETAIGHLRFALVEHAGTSSEQCCGASQHHTPGR